VEFSGTDKKRLKSILAHTSDKRRMPWRRILKDGTMELADIHMDDLPVYLIVAARVAAVRYGITPEEYVQYLSIRSIETNGEALTPKMEAVYRPIAQVVERVDRELGNTLSEPSPKE
jgi:hypothetical protein